ncbi:hypothetical protein H2248_011708 [Termitomyces sp. 'cryptogamus']|nr:hypothetical protein H2248_011708 [Termitomyces sp. 'cryptogamus']
MPARACLADYGLAPVLNTVRLFTHHHLSNLLIRRTSHFVAPEDTSNTEFYPFSTTEASDVYALMAAAFVIFVGYLPPKKDVRRVSRNIQYLEPFEVHWPLEPIYEHRGLNGSMLQLMADSWQEMPEKRPKACEIVQRIRKIQEEEVQERSRRRVFVEGLHSKLNIIFKDVTKYRHLLSYSGANAQTFLDASQLLLDTFDSPNRAQLIAAMRRLSERTELYPTCFFLDGDVPPVIGLPSAAGSYADIYKINFQDKQTCFKVIRVSQRSLVGHMAKIYAREAIVWSQLAHPNILPFYGFSKLKSRLAFVTSWATNGHLQEYLAQNPNANRVLLCSDTANGVDYLHKNDIIHGDLKGFNVLIDISGRAYLADFGLSSVTDPEIIKWTSQPAIGSKGGTTRWKAPELFKFKTTTIQAYNTKASDVYAWACICYEVDQTIIMPKRRLTLFL